MESSHPEELGPVTAMRRLGEHRKEAMLNAARRSRRDLNLAPRNHGTREDRGSAH